MREMTKIEVSTLPDGSLRRRVLEALRMFRASWVELGRFLNEVAYGGDYKEWGYDDFVVYCARELGLKKPTVQKLMVSYNYMKKYEAKRLVDFEGEPDRPAAGNLPDFQTVELLDRARRNDGVAEDDVEKWHARAFSDADSAGDETELRKELRGALKPPAKADDIDGGGRRRSELAKVLCLARQLRRALSGVMVPEGLRERLERGLVELEALD